jgi:hypothetical protein
MTRKSDLDKRFRHGWNTDKTQIDSEIFVSVFYPC